MTLDQAINLMPRYIKGELPKEEMLQLSRMLVASPELMEEMRLALMLCDLMEESLAVPPAFPAAIYQQNHRPTLVPQALKDSYKTVKSATTITQSALKMLLKFM